MREEERSEQPESEDGAEDEDMELDYTRAFTVSRQGTVSRGPVLFTLKQGRDLEHYLEMTALDWPLRLRVPAKSGQRLSVHLIGEESGTEYYIEDAREERGKFSIILVPLKE